MIKITLLIIAASFFISSCASSRSYPDPNDEKIKSAEINIQLGMGYLARQDVQRAKQKLLNALEQAPQLPESWYSMAYFKETTGNSTEAKKYYLKSVALAPKRGDVLNNYGTYLCRTGNYQDAIRYFQGATQDPDYLDVASACENAGLCALKIPNQKLAMYYFRMAVTQDPKRPISLAEL